MHGLLNEKARTHAFQNPINNFSRVDLSSKHLIYALQV